MKEVAERYGLNESQSKEATQIIHKCSELMPYEGSYPLLTILGLPLILLLFIVVFIGIILVIFLAFIVNFIIEKMKENVKKR